MVTYFNGNDMSNYAEWVVKQMYPLPKNWVVKISGTREHQIFCMYLNEQAGANRKDEFLTSLLDSIYFEPVVKNTSISALESCSDWCFGIVDREIVKNSFAFLQENKFKLGLSKVEVIPVELFLLHAMGIDKNRFGFSAWQEAIGKHAAPEYLKPFIELTKPSRGITVRIDGPQGKGASQEYADCQEKGMDFIWGGMTICTKDSGWFWSDNNMMTYNPK